MKRLLLFLALMMMHTYIIAAPISESEARKKAARFVSSKNGNASLARQTQRFDNTSKNEATLTVAEIQEAYYVYNIDSYGGYVIVSGDDRMPDVLGYSYNGTYDADDIPDNMRTWLEGYAEEYKYLQTHANAKGASVTAIAGNTVYPMLDCQWNQNSPFNNLCPIIDGEQSPAGCIATTMAQIMYYFQWPNYTTKPIPSYVTKRHQIAMPEIGITKIDWNNITPKYARLSSDIEKQAVSTLMLLCGCAVQTNYKKYAGGALDDEAAKAFKEYFDYGSVSLIERKNYTIDEWNQIIYNEIKSGRPVYYSGEGSYGGHAFVIDGYNGDNYFHVNWGIISSYDGYFLLTSLNPPDGSSYNEDQTAIIGIQGQGNIEHKYAYAELIGNTLTFYYDNNRESRTGELFLNLDNHNWTKDNYKGSIKYVKFDPAFQDYKSIISLESMFENLSNLISVEGLEYLNTERVEDMSYMFNECSNLTSVTLPDGITSIGEYAFYNCSSLKSVRMPNNVTTICEGAFYNCSSLKSIRIPYAVKNIETYAFMGCSSLTDVYCYAENIPTTSSYAFSSYNIANATLHVSGTSKKKYENTSPWSYFKEVVALTADYYDFNRSKTTLEDRAEWTEKQKSAPNAVAFVEKEQESWAASQKNVVVENGNQYYCPNFVLTDFSLHAGINYEQTGFYTPYGFTIKNGSYMRQAYTGYNTICVPFSFKASELSETAKIYAFDSYDENENKVIFKRVKQRVEPGTPCIVKETNNIIWNISLAGKTISASDPRESGYMRGTFVTTDSYQGNGYSPNYLNEFAPLSQYLHPFRACFVMGNETRARNISLALDDDITDINEVKAYETVLNDGKYIENGRMVIYKNGKKYNINGVITK